MELTTEPEADLPCADVAEILALVGEKWTVSVVVALHAGKRRFNELRRAIGGISHQMLSRTLKALEQDGLVARAVHPSTPPEVSYSLTSAGVARAARLHALADWAIDHRDAMQRGREASTQASRPADGAAV